MTEPSRQHYWPQYRLTNIAQDIDMNLVEVSLDSIDACRSLMLDSHPTLLEGTIEDNLTLGRSSIAYEDVQWALQFVELDEEVDRCITLE